MKVLGDYLRSNMKVMDRYQTLLSVTIIFKKIIVFSFEVLLFLLTRVFSLLMKSKHSNMNKKLSTPIRKQNYLGKSYPLDIKTIIICIFYFFETAETILMKLIKIFLMTQMSSLKMKKLHSKLKL